MLDMLVINWKDVGMQWIHEWDEARTQDIRERIQDSITVDNLMHVYYNNYTLQKQVDGEWVSLDIEEVIEYFKTLPR